MSGVSGDWSGEGDTCSGSGFRNAPRSFATYRPPARHSWAFMPVPSGSPSRPARKSAATRHQPPTASASRQPWRLPAAFRGNCTAFRDLPGAVSARAPSDRLAWLARRGCERPSQIDLGNLGGRIASRWPNTGTCHLSRRPLRQNRVVAMEFMRGWIIESPGPRRVVTSHPTPKKHSCQQMFWTTPINFAYNRTRSASRRGSLPSLSPRQRGCPAL